MERNVRNNFISSERKIEVFLSKIVGYSFDLIKVCLTKGQQGYIDAQIAVFQCLSNLDNTQNCLSTKCPALL